MYAEETVTESEKRDKLFCSLEEDRWTTRILTSIMVENRTAKERIQESYGGQKRKKWLSGTVKWQTA